MSLIPMLSKFIEENRIEI